MRNYFAICAPLNQEVRFDLEAFCGVVGHAA